MKKLNLLWVFAVLMAGIVSAGNAGIPREFMFNSTNINVTLNSPPLDHFTTNDNGFVLNVSVYRTSAMNITNVTFIFVLGSNTTRFINSTINGTNYVTQTARGDFTYNITNAGLTEGIWNVTVEVRNATEVSNKDTSLNTTSFLLGIDRTGAAIQIQEPLSGSTVVPNNNYVTVAYVPTESNLGNCSLHLNNQLVTSSTSGSISPNVTSGLTNKFNAYFGADNTSVRVAVSCIDLAGVGSSSNSLNNFTFNVLLGTISYAVRQLQQGGGGDVVPTTQPSQQSQSFSLASPPSANISQYATHLQQWGWVYAFAVIITLIIIYRKKFR